MTSTAIKSAIAAGGSQSGSLLPRAVMLILRVAACGYAASGTPDSLSGGPPSLPGPSQLTVKMRAGSGPILATVASARAGGR